MTNPFHLTLGTFSLGVPTKFEAHGPEQEAMPDAAMHEFVSPRGNPIVRLSTAMHEVVIPRGNLTDHGPYMVSYRQLNQITCPRRHPHAAVNQVRETDSSANLTEP